MKRRTFLKCSGMAAGMAHQPATQQVLEPESSFDLIDSKESELSELVCTKTSLWGLARHVGEKSSFRLARRPIPQGPVRTVPLPTGFHMSLAPLESRSSVMV